jgi:hypothetical protein
MDFYKCNLFKYNELINYKYVSSGMQIALK